MKFPVVQTKRFAQKLVLKKVERKVQAFVNSLGQERIEWMIQNQKPLASFLTAEQASAYSQKAKAVSWVASIVSDEDFDALFEPPEICVCGAGLDMHNNAEGYALTGCARYRPA